MTKFKGKPKFKIGDIVCMKNDDFHFNPATKVLSIGKVESIHIHTQEQPEKINNMKNMMFVKHPIVYSVSGFSLMPAEHKLKLYKEKNNA